MRHRPGITLIAAACLAGLQPGLARQQQAPTSAPAVAPEQVRLDPQLVRQIQRRLDARGHPVGRAGGTWSAQATSALRAFQREQGLEPTGRISRQTLSALGLLAECATGGEHSAMIRPPQDEPPRLGLSDQLLRRVERELSKRGYDAGGVDGQWTEQSEQALRTFQQAAGLQPSGELDHETITALQLNLSKKP